MHCKRIEWEVGTTLLTVWNALVKLNREILDNKIETSYIANPRRVLCFIPFQLMKAQGNCKKHNIVG